MIGDWGVCLPDLGNFFYPIRSNSLMMGNMRVIPFPGYPVENGRSLTIIELDCQLHREYLSSHFL